MIVSAASPVPARSAKSVCDGATRRGRSNPQRGAEPEARELASNRARPGHRTLNWRGRARGKYSRAVRGAMPSQSQSTRRTDWRIQRFLAAGLSASPAGFAILRASAAIRWTSSRTLDRCTWFNVYLE